MRTLRSCLYALVGLAVAPAAAPAGPIPFRVVAGDPVVEPGHPDLGGRLKSLFGGTREFQFDPVTDQFVRAPLFRLDPAPAAPPDSAGRITREDGRVQAIDLAEFRMALQFTDLASGEQGSFEYVGNMGSNWLQNANGGWTLLEDYAVVNLPSRELTLGGHLYNVTLVQTSPRQSDLVATPLPTPTPEPGTIALAATGLLPLLRLIRRRKR